MKFLRVIGAAIRALMHPEGRRAWALVFLAAGGAVMTAYAAVALWLVSNRAGYVFQLGLAAHIEILIVITGFAGLLVKRTIVAQLGKDRKLEFSDQAEAAAAAADEVAGAATEAAADIKGQST